jgi:alkaline phosphatase D
MAATADERLVSTPQLHLDGYQAFLEHMCPGTALAGQVPPPGTDPSACPKPIMGVYDDHDFGWNNGNRRCAAAG